MIDIQNMAESKLQEWRTDGKGGGDENEEKKRKQDKKKLKLLTDGYRG